MFTIINNSPVLKEKNIVFRIFVAVLSIVSGVFIISPVISYFANGAFPLSEMPDNTAYYILRGVFGISLTLAAAVYVVFKNVTVTAIPSFLGIVTSLIPLIYRINKYTDHKKFVEKFSMTADYTSYLVGIGIYILFILLCLFTLLYALGFTPANLIVLIVSAVTITAVILITIDRAKNIEFGIFNIYDILCFSYVAIAAIIPALVVTSSKKRSSDEPKTPKRQKYQPKRMRS